MAVSFIPTPLRCDVCGGMFPDAAGTLMYDAPTMFGPWACMCKRCWIEQNPLQMLGIGKGQRYEKTTMNGPFLLMEGAPL